MQIYALYLKYTIFREILWAMDRIYYLASAMPKVLLHIAVFVSALLACVQAEGQAFRSVGLYSSFKGIGIEGDFTGKAGNLNSIRLYADIYGLPSGNIHRPGVKLCYSSDYILKTTRKQYCDVCFHLGPGVSLGYVKDYNTQNSPGAVLGLTGTVGWLFKFNRKVSLDLSWTLEAGMHLRQENGVGRLSLYKNGIYRFPFPQLTIIREF